jgi:SMC interacting uncharacterized protein involved in chromosome segregation
MNDNQENHEPAMRALDEMAMHPERELRRMLADLHREYQARVAPIVKALANYEALRPRLPVIIPMLPDDHPLVVNIRAAAERALEDGTGAYRLTIRSDSETSAISAEVVRRADMYESPTSDEQHACAKSLDSRKYQQ